MNKILLNYLLLFSIQLPAQHSIQYIANEGILVESNGQRLLIDALFDDYYEDYLAPSSQAVEAMTEKVTPYESIDLYLSTHVHRDHFYSEMVVDFMLSHDETSFISTQQATDSMRLQPAKYSQVEARIKGWDKEAGWKEVVKNGISVQSAYVRHGGRRNYGIDNLIFLIELNRKKILHLGDAEMDTTHFGELGLEHQAIDVALIPYWFLAYSPGVEIVKNHIKPQMVIAIHYPKVGDPKSLKLLKQNFPEVIVFSTAGQEVTF